MSRLFNISLDSSLAELPALWDRSPEICTDELSRSMEEALLLMEREVLELTPRGATNALRNQITSLIPGPQPLDTGDVIGLVTGTAAHTVAVEMGTRPHFVPIAPLMDWVKAKLGIDGDEGRQVAFAISRKIARHGTRGAAMFRRALEVNNNEQRVQQIMAAATPRIVERLMEAGL